MEKVYIRFTDDIESDIERGYSKDIHGNKLSGLCAWSTPYYHNNDGRYEDSNGNEITVQQIEKYAQQILNNTYGSYSSNETVSVISGTYVGSGNDGVLLTDVEEIDYINL